MVGFDQCINVECTFEVSVYNRVLDTTIFHNTARNRRKENRPVDTLSPSFGPDDESLVPDDDSAAEHLIQVNQLFDDRLKIRLRF